MELIEFKDVKEGDKILQFYSREGFRAVWIGIADYSHYENELTLDIQLALDIRSYYNDMKVFDNVSGVHDYSILNLDRALLPHDINLLYKLTDSEYLKEISLIL
jgi:hypothetical protein